MQEITLKIPDQKYNFFIELITSLGFEVSDDESVPQWHKDKVLNRIKLSDENPERLIDWENMAHSFKLD